MNRKLLVDFYDDSKPVGSNLSGYNATDTLVFVPYYSSFLTTTSVVSISRALALIANALRKILIDDGYRVVY